MPTTVRTRLIVFLAVAAFIAGVMVGLGIGSNNVVWGKVDLLAARSKEVVSLSKSTTFLTATGDETVLAAGTALNLEGTDGHVHYLSLYLLIDSAGSFDTVQDASGDVVYWETSPGQARPGGAN